MRFSHQSGRSTTWLALGRIDAHKLCLSEMIVIRSGLPINILLAVQIRGSIVA